MATPFFSQIARAGLALVAVLNGDSEAAREHYKAFSPARGTLITVAGVSGDHFLGLLTQTIGDLDKAAEHFENALPFCRKAGYRPELAWTCCDYADMLMERNDEGDRAKTVSLLEESLSISTELGMRPLMERVMSRREILGA